MIKSLDYRDNFDDFRTAVAERLRPVILDQGSMVYSGVATMHLWLLAKNWSEFDVLVDTLREMAVNRGGLLTSFDFDSREVIVIFRDI